MSAIRAIMMADGRAQARGALTCAVRLTNSIGAQDERLYVVSCLHVLALAQEYYPEFPSGAVVLSDKVPAAETTSHLGFLLNRYCYSFDAAIARVTDPVAIRRLLPPVTPTSYALNAHGVAGEAEIHVPEEDPVEVHSPRFLYGDRLSIPYEAGTPLSRIQVWHRQIVEWSFRGRSTRPGHSGSPVLSKDGERLLGMHIAGSGDHAYMIPAWDLLEAGNYYGLSRSRPMSLASF